MGHHSHRAHAQTLTFLYEYTHKIWLKTNGEKKSSFLKGDEFDRNVSDEPEDGQTGGQDGQRVVLGIALKAKVFNKGLVRVRHPDGDNLIVVNFGIAPEFVDDQSLESPPGKADNGRPGPQPPR